MGLGLRLARLLPGIGLHRKVVAVRDQAAPVLEVHAEIGDGVVSHALVCGAVGGAAGRERKGGAQGGLVSALHLSGVQG